jgi:Domain of unknown function (DUF5666)
MRPTLVALALTFAVVSWPAQASAQSTKAHTAKGTVTAMAADSVTVKVANTDMTFMVDSKTHVVAPGAGTKARAAKQSPAGGPTLAEVIKVGQPVSVSYHDMGGKLHAASITAISSAAAEPAAPKSSRGTVESVSATSMTIHGSSGSGAKFTQTFTVDANTKVIGTGAGTKTQGAKVAITDLVANGDTVAVSYHEMGTTLHAADVRVTAKAAKTAK